MIRVATNDYWWQITLFFLMLQVKLCPVLHHHTLQDADLSRNMPGKVKVSAPNLLAAKKK